MESLFQTMNLPHSSIEAEQAVLGAIFLEPEKIEIALEKLVPSDFYSVAHRKLFEVMVSLYMDGGTVDLVTVTERLLAKGIMDEIGGVSYLSDLASFSPTAANIEWYMKIVKEKSILRKLKKTCEEIIQSTYSDEPIEEILNLAEKKILEISPESKGSELTLVKDVLVDTYMHLEDLFYRNEEITGLPTGYIDLDRMTSGLHKTDFIIVAARPSVGKTAFALNVAQNVAKKRGETVAIFSLEMSTQQLVNRMLSSEGNIESKKLRTGQLSDSDWIRLTMAMGTLSSIKLYIDDTPGITVNEIRSKCRKLKQSSGLGLIVIDYLQLIGGGSAKKENRQQEVSEISRALKALAKELDVPVIALSQLSRSVESRQDKRPMLSDLRESGSIEQDADMVAFLYRDDYYNKDSEAKNIIEIIIAKQRNGPVGTVELGFLKEYGKFVNLDRRMVEK
jgi:replicative DNA helicase